MIAFVDEQIRLPRKYMNATSECWNSSNLSMAELSSFHGGLYAINISKVQYLMLIMKLWYLMATTASGLPRYAALDYLLAQACITRHEIACIPCLCEWGH